MLKQEHPEEQTAAKVRVTPEELAAAITALQYDQNGSDDKIAIGDAVNELSLDATPEDILQAVYVRRQQQKKQRRKKRFGGIAAALVVMSAAFAGMLHHSHRQPILSKPVQAAISHSALELRSVDTVPDGQDFYADPHALAQFFQKVQNSKIKVSLTDSDQKWEMVKHDGKVYLTAFEPAITARELEQKHIVLYNCQMEEFFNDKSNSTSDNVGFPTIPLEGVQLEDTQTDDHGEKIVVSNIHPDNYLW
jgi:hypothetical protein